MLTWRVGIEWALSIGWWGSWPSTLTTKHLLSSNPAWLLICLVKPWCDDFISKILVPNTYQVLLETFIPHERMSMIWSIRDNCKQAGWRSANNFSFIVKNLSITIQVWHTSKHVTDCKLSSSHLCFIPVWTVSFFLHVLNFLIKLE